MFRYKKKKIKTKAEFRHENDIVKTVRYCQYVISSTQVRTYIFFKFFVSIIRLGVKGSLTTSYNALITWMDNRCNRSHVYIILHASLGWC